MLLGLFAVFLLPLFFHHSETPVFGGYDAAYGTGLALALIVSVIVAFYVSLRCRRTGSRRPAWSAVAIVLSAAAALLIGEIFLRHVMMDDAFTEYRKWGHRKSVVFGFEAAPNNKWSGSGATYSTDEFGFRTHTGDTQWHSRAAGDAGDELKVFAVGGSSVFGNGLNDDETWPHLLETALSKANPDRRVTVVNAGNSGHNSLQVLLRFYLRVAEHRPTHVIFYEAMNDVKFKKWSVDNAIISERILFSPSLIEFVREQNRDKNFYMRTILGHWVHTRLAAPEDADAPEAWSVNTQWTDDGLAEIKDIVSHNAAQYARAVLTLSDMCRRNGSTLVLVTFIDDLDGTLAGAVNIRYNLELRQIAATENLPLIDLDTDFQDVPNKDAYFRDDHYHPNRQGAKYIAEKLSDGLVEILAQ